MNLIELVIGVMLLVLSGLLGMSALLVIDRYFPKAIMATDRFLNRKKKRQIMKPQFIDITKPRDYGLFRESTQSNIR